MLRRFAFIFFFTGFCVTLNGQDIDYARELIHTLCSEKYAGRGYVNGGDRMAADLIRTEFAKHKLFPLGQDYFQHLGFPVIYYPGQADLSADDVPLAAGEDFIVNPGCPTLKGIYQVLILDSAMMDNSYQFKKLQSRNLKNYFLAVDGLKNLKLLNPDRIKWVLENGLNARGLLYTKAETLTWGVSMDWAPFPIIFIKKDRISQSIIRLVCNIEAAHKVHGTQNVLGYFKGLVYPDSFIVITAHYDHLGMLGTEAVFPGANDNASGVAMMLDMARHYSLKPPAYSVLFIAFAAEEIGLIGSNYFVENPLINLKKISLLLNLDLMSTGDKGMTVVNATEFPDLYENLKFCNSIGSYLPLINPRGKAKNSDHYYFTQAGVPSFFFYLLGDYHHYHDVDDTYQAITLSKYNEAFQLIVDFVNMKMRR